MNRRTLLRQAAAAGTALSLAGCLRRGGDDEALSVSASSFEQNEDGNLVVRITVSNPTDREASGTLYVNSNLNGESLTRVREVQLDAHSTTVVDIEYDVAYEDVESFDFNTDLVEE